MYIAGAVSPRLRPLRALLAIGLLAVSCARLSPCVVADGAQDEVSSSSDAQEADRSNDCVTSTTGLPCVSRPLAAGGRTSGRLLAGAATRVITPDLGNSSRPVYMAGLDVALKATEVHDDLFARALVLTDGSGLTVGLVVLDLIGFFHDDVLDIREELKREHPEVAIDYVAVASTHTHAGPDVLGLWCRKRGCVDGGYVARIRHEAAEAVAAAWKARKPAEVFVAQSVAPDLCQDRRLPELIDETLLVMGLRSTESGEGIATLVNWNSHPSVAGAGNTAISADFPGALVKSMEEGWGGVGLYVSGDLGGQISSRRAKIRDESTGQRVQPSSMALVEALGDQLAGLALDALRESRSRGPAPDPRIRVTTRAMHVPLANPLFLKGLRKGIIHPRRMYSPDGDGPGKLPSEIRKKSAFEPGASSLRTETAVVDLGSAVWALLPGEPYPELALGKYQDPQDPGADFQGAPREPALRAMSSKPVFIIGLGNDLLGYLIPKSQWDYEPPFAYGRKSMQYGEKVSVGPDAAPLVMEALREMLQGPLNTELPRGPSSRRPWPVVLLKGKRKTG